MELPARTLFLLLPLLVLANPPAGRAAESAPPASPADLAAAVAPDGAAATPAVTEAGAAEAPPVGDAPPATRVPWRGDPVAVALKVEAERRIDFPEPIADLDVPKDLERQSRIVLTPAGHLHWTARAPFPPARVLATSVSGTLYQLDVGARAEGAAPERLVLADPVLDAATTAQASAPDARARLDRAAGALIPEFLKDAPAGRSGGSSYAALARFALARYSGPARLIPQLDAHRVAVRPVATRAWLRVQAAALEVRPLAQWQVGDRYVTALGVYNRGPWPVPFEPRALRGDLLFAAALHPMLGPQGSGHNGTVWAVVTEKPFNQAVAADVAGLARAR